MIRSYIHSVIWIVCLTFSAISAFSAGPDAELILQKVKDKFEQVEDYKASVSIQVDVDFVKIGICFVF